MPVNYNKLWKLLIDKNMKRTDLLSGAHISTTVLAKMGRGDYINLKSIESICRFLECDINDILDLNIR